MAGPHAPIDLDGGDDRSLSDHRLDVCGGEHRPYAIFTSLDQSLDGLLPLGSWLTGVGRNGLGRFVVPMLIGIVFGASMAGMAFLPDRIQYWVKMGSILALMVVVFGRFLTAWIWEMITQLEVSAPGSQSEYLVGPILMLLQIGVMAFYFLPVILGTRGIWGLSRRGVVWSIGYMLLFLGIHALLTFQVIRDQIDAGGQLRVLDIQVQDPEIGLFGIELVPHNNSV